MLSTLFGLNVGSGQYLLGGMLYIFLFVILLIDRYLEHVGWGIYGLRVTISFRVLQLPGPSEEMKAYLDREGSSSSIDMEELNQRSAYRTLTRPELLNKPKSSLAAGVLVMNYLTFALEKANLQHDLYSYTYEKEGDAIKGKLVVQVRAVQRSVTGFLRRLKTHLDNVDVKIQLLGVNIAAN